MEIKSNGVSKEVQVLKHFKVNEDVYILYKDGETISLGQIIENKINTPNAEKMGVIKTLIGNFISSNPSNTINDQNGCVVLNNNIEDSLEEISTQHIKLSNEQLSNLTHEKDLSNVEYKPMYTNFDDKKGKGGIIGLIVVLVIVIGLGVSAFIFRDNITKFVKSKIPKMGQTTKDTDKNNNTNNNINNNINNNTNNGTKKNTSKNKTNTSDPKKALENAYTTMINNDYDSFINLMPKALREYYKAELTPELFKEASKQITEEVGTNIKIDVNVTPKKMDASWIETNQEYMQEEFGSNTKLVECYEYTGTVTFSGSKGQKILTDKDLYETWYCKVNNDWGFIFG